MKPTKKLILALRETAQLLREKPEKYKWFFPNTCNCGLLCQALGEKEFRVGAWSIAAANGFCSTTGLPIKKLFKTLSEFGLEKKDFNEIEHCIRDGKIGNFKNPAFVAVWMDERADQLEKERAKLLVKNEL